MKKDMTTYYLERLDYILKKNMEEGINGLRQQDFKLAQKDVSDYLKKEN